MLARRRRDNQIKAEKIGRDDQCAARHLPWFADSHVEFRKAVHVRIKGKTETTIDIEYEDAAHEFGVSGQLSWLGRIRNWTLQPKQAGEFLFAAGLDADGDYTISQDGTPAHWERWTLLRGSKLSRTKSERNRLPVRRRDG